MIGRWKSSESKGEEQLKGFDDFHISLGDVMRGERATMGKSLLDVQCELHIKSYHLEAIENCDPSGFETPGFIAGYVRSYARYLGMNPDSTFEWFCVESGFQPSDGISVSKARAAHRNAAREQKNTVPFSQTGIAFNAPPQTLMQRIDPGALGGVLVVLALIGGLGYAGWTVFQKVQQVQVEEVAETPVNIIGIDPLNRAVMDLNDGAALQEVASADFDRLYAPEALEVPVIEARDGPISSLDPDRSGILVLSNAPEPIVEDPVVQVTDTAVEELVIVAVRPSWVQITDATGAVLLEKIMNAGEEFVVPNTENPPVLRSGESGAIYFSANGVHYGPAGQTGQVTSNIELSSISLQEAYPIANLEVDADLARMVAQAEE